MTVGAGVGVTRGTTVDPHPATLNAAIAVPMTVVRFTTASAHATEARHNSYMRADAPNIFQPLPAGPAALLVVLVGGAVDPFADEIRVAVVPRVFLDHVVEDPAHRDLTT
jgi:acyl CoA:acetate/3-ketoacid CoA transferase alpha subunit